MIFINSAVLSHSVGVFQLVTVILVVLWMTEHVIHAQMWQTVWRQVVVIVRQMLTVVVVTGARTGSGTLIPRILKVVNVRTILVLFLNYKRMCRTLIILLIWYAIVNIINIFSLYHPVSIPIIQGFESTPPIR
jgi:hypothetical protein